jgi:hypothetical protein
MGAGNPRIISSPAWEILWTAGRVVEYSSITEDE